MSERKKYDIALSFAGQDRAIVELVAKALKTRGVDVFYDAFETTHLWGKNLYTHLSDLYQNQARYCIPFLSKAYADRSWPNHELQAMQARAFLEIREYLLPVRLDDTPIDGILGTVASLSMPPASPEQIADAACAKLERQPSVLAPDFSEGRLNKLEGLRGGCRPDGKPALHRGRGVGQVRQGAQATRHEALSKYRTGDGSCPRYPSVRAILSRTLARRVL